MKPPLIYALYTGNLYGTERMALATAWALRDEFAPVILAPAGPVTGEATKMGFEVVVADTTSVPSLAVGLGALLAKNERLAFIGTRPVHSLVFAALNVFFRRRAGHVFVVHGGGWANKRRLNGLPVTIVAISAYVRERLLAHGVRDRQVRVIEDFLTDARIASAPRRRAFVEPGIRRVAVIGRLSREKRVDMLLGCLERHPELAAIEFHIYGGGNESGALQARALAGGLNVVFEGFRRDVPEQLALADLFLHLTHEEPFGLVVLEAMAAGVPVLVPDGGGAGAIVEDGVSGIHFAANDAESLAGRLAELQQAAPERLNAFAAAARTALETRFSESARVGDYRALLRAGIGDGDDAKRAVANERAQPIAPGLRL